MARLPLAARAKPAAKEYLLDKILNRTAVVGVVGLGYVGLPFAVEKAKVGFRVIGIEENPARAEKVNRAENYIRDVADADLRRVVVAGTLTARTDFAAVPEMDVVVICVPTPLTRNLTPDLHYVEHVTREIARHLRPGQLVSLESTTYPGTTEELMLPILEGSGLKAERDFFLVHSPERVDPGNKRYTTRNISKVVGGVGPSSLEVGVAFYRQTVAHVVPVSSARAAELVKVFENTFRAVNIALVNELAMLCDRMGLNVWEVLDAAFTKPFGIMPFYPGPGVGGHSVPVDPYYLSCKVREVDLESCLTAVACDTNRRMPVFVREKTLRILKHMGLAPSRARVLFLGATYKRDVPDCRGSPALRVMELLLRDGVDVSYHDPYVPRLIIDGRILDAVPLDPENLAAAHLVVITTDHSDIDYETVVAHARHVFDTRNATRNVTSNRERITLI